MDAATEAHGRRVRVGWVVDAENGFRRNWSGFSRLHECKFRGLRARCCAHTLATTESTTWWARGVASRQSGVR